MFINLAPFELQPDGDPIIRVVGVMFGYAIKDGIQEIQIPVPPEQRAFPVFFRQREKDELLHQMQMPFYIWKPLRAHLEKLAGEDGAFKVDLKSENLPISLCYRIEMSIAGDAESETIVLKLNGEFLSTHSQNNP